MSSDSSGNDLAEDLQEAFSITKSIKSKFKKFGKKLFRRGNGAGNDIPSFPPPAGAAADAGAAPESDAEVVRRGVKEAKVRGGYYKPKNPHQEIPKKLQASHYGQTPAHVQGSSGPQDGHKEKKCRECDKKIATHKEYCEDHQTLADANDISPFNGKEPESHYGKTPVHVQGSSGPQDGHKEKKCRECGKKIATHGEYCEDHQTLADARDD